MVAETVSTYICIINVKMNANSGRLNVGSARIACSKKDTTPMLDDLRRGN